jgi:hypothetical protein
VRNCGITHIRRTTDQRDMDANIHVPSQTCDALVEHFRNLFNLIVGSTSLVFSHSVVIYSAPIPSSKETEAFCRIRALASKLTLTSKT